MKRKIGQLRLQKETVRALTARDLERANGGIPRTEITSCGHVCPIQGAPQE